MKKTITGLGRHKLSRSARKKVKGGGAYVFYCLGDGLCFTDSGACYRYCIREYDGVKCKALPGTCPPLTPDI